MSYSTGATSTLDITDLSVEQAPIEFVVTATTIGGVSADQKVLVSVSGGTCGSEKLSVSEFVS